MSNQNLDFNKIIYTLRSNIWYIIFITLFFTANVGVYAYFLKPIYSSNVTISIVNEQSAKLAAVLPGELKGFSETGENLKSTQLTLKSRKFINTVVENLNINKYFSIKKRFKKIEVDGFKNLDVNLLSFDTSLYDVPFEIKPINDKYYQLIIEAIQVNQPISYGRTIKNNLFTLTVKKNGRLEEKDYFFQIKNNSTITNTIISNMYIHILSDDVIQITYNDTLPKRAKIVVEAIAKKFIDYSLDKKTSEVEQTLIFLNEQVNSIQKNLNNNSNQLRKYQEKNKSFISIASSHQIYTNLIKKKETLKKLKIQIREINTFKYNLKNDNLNIISLINNGIDISSIQSLIELYREEELKIEEIRYQEHDIRKPTLTNAYVENLIKQLNENYQHLDTLSSSFTQEHPQIVKTRQVIDELEYKIKNFIISELQKSLNTQKHLKNKIATNISLMGKSLNNNIFSLKKDIQEKNILLNTLPKKELETQSLKRNFALSENVYTFLLSKKMELEMKKASTISNTQIIEDPIIPKFPIKPQKQRITLTGFIVGLILGIIFVLLKEFLDTKIRDIQTIEANTDTPVYGTLPINKNQRYFKEALRNIRTNLQFILPENKECTIILVSSTVAGEGKTTIIAGLAEVIAHTDKKVLLMDLDLRKPRLYQELKQSNKIGMSNFLTQHLTIEEVIQSVSPNIDFFPAGTIPPNPSELLMSQKFEETIHLLMQEYDYILFDSAPIGTVIDANMLLKYIDVLLLVLKAHSAEKSYLHNFNKMVKEKNIKSSGIILNQVKIQSDSGYGYGYGYDYGYGEGK